MESKNRIVIAGGTGFLGLSLARYLTELDKVSGAWRFVRWDARSVGSWVGELDGSSGKLRLTVVC